MTLSTGQRLLLPVRQYYVQTDSRIPGQAYRMCFSSTCAMAVKYLRPDALKGSNADDTYLHTLRRYGDEPTKAIGRIVLDASFSPVSRVSYAVENARFKSARSLAHSIAAMWSSRSPSSMIGRGTGSGVTSLVGTGAALSMSATSSATYIIEVAPGNTARTPSEITRALSTKCTR